MKWEYEGPGVLDIVLFHMRHSILVKWSRKGYHTLKFPCKMMNFTTTSMEHHLVHFIKQHESTLTYYMQVHVDCGRWARGHEAWCNLYIISRRVWPAIAEENKEIATGGNYHEDTPSLDIQGVPSLPSTIQILQFIKECHVWFVRLITMSNWGIDGRVDRGRQMKSCHRRLQAWASRNELVNITGVR